MEAKARGLTWAPLDLRGRTDVMHQGWALAANRRRAFADTIETLMMAMAGRSVFDELEGDGASIFRGRF